MINALATAASAGRTGGHTGRTGDRVKPQNLVEKITQRYALNLEANQVVQSGDYLLVSPAHVMTHDNTGAVIPKFKSIGAAKIANARQPVFALDHNVQDTGKKNLTKYRMIQAFAQEMGVDFYPAGRGIGHQIICEEGYAWPGTMVVASDSHSNMYGGLGCLGTPIVRTDAAALWATGHTWWQVPPVAKVELQRKLRPGVSGKDVIITLCGFFNQDEVLNHAVEFTGPGVATLSLSERLTIANMTTEWGALVGLFPVDQITLAWLEQRIAYIKERGLEKVPSDIDGNGAHPRMNDCRLKKLRNEPSTADSDAFYAKHLTLDLETVSPYVSGPNHVKVMTSVAEMKTKKLAIDKAYLVSCVNSRLDDLSAAAHVVAGKRIADGVQFYIAAASKEVQKDSETRGDWQKLIAAGATVLPPGCGPCIGLGSGLLEDGEVGISATNRNFKGRMGSRNAEAYLASPEVVAASAISGFIDQPKELKPIEINGSVRSNKAKTETVTVSIISGFPAEIRGEILFCPQDNLNTDGIYPGKYTYIDDFSAEDQARVVMENYDPEFGNIARDGDIVVGGFNFGTGSSREQAATAFKYLGIRLIIAGSFSETYKRNALNNGFLTIESPTVVNELKDKFSTKNPTIRTGLEAKINFANATIKINSTTYPFNPLGAAAQELVVADGLENWVRKRLTN